MSRSFNATLLYGDWLYIGGAFDAGPSQLEASGVRWVLNVKGGALPKAGNSPNPVRHKCKPLCDYGRSDLTKAVAGICRFLTRAREAKEKALVHCRMGVNRSATAVLAYLLLEEGIPLRDAALLLLRAHPRALPHPLYLEQLVKMDATRSCDLAQLTALFPPLGSPSSRCVLAMQRRFSGRETPADGRPAFASPVVLQEEYQRLRRLWNGMLERYPTAFVMPSGRADAADAVAMAKEHGQSLCVRGGGHSVTGLSGRTGQVVLDMRQLRQVWYEEEARLAHVGGGATWRDVDRELSGLGRACVAGLVGHTGVAGLCLGGGMGWLSRLHGLSCDNLLGIEGVAGTGELVTVRPADAESSDLMFGMRGAGGNFAAVTRLSMRTHPVFCALLSLLEWHNPEQAVHRDAVMQAYQSYCTAPELPRWAVCYAWLSQHVTLLAFVDIVEEEAQFPERQHAHLSRISAFASKACPTLDHPLSILSMAELNSHWDMGNAHGDWYYWSKSTLLPRGLPEGFVSSMVGPLVDAHPDVTVEIMQLGGKLTEPTNSCFFQRPNLCGFECHAIGCIRNPGAELSAQEYTQRWQSIFRALVLQLAPYSVAGGRYLNVDNLESQGSEAGTTHGAETHLAEVFGSNWPRLQALKARYDPQNLFLHNHNIPPPSVAGSSTSSEQ